MRSGGALAAHSEKKREFLSLISTRLENREFHIAALVYSAVSEYRQTRKIIFSYQAIGLFPFRSSAD